MINPLIGVIREALNNCTLNGHEYPTDTDGLLGELLEHGVIETHDKSLAILAIHEIMKAEEL